MTFSIYFNQIIFFSKINIIGLINRVEDNDIANKIETLGNRFDALRTRIISELSAKRETVETLLDTLTSLPPLLRREYASSIEKKISFMRKETRVDLLFVEHLNPLISFIDYGLIEHLIKKFGSDALKKDMQSYSYEMVIFMKETMIKQLIDHLPGQPEIPPKFSLVEAKIGQDASRCTLEQLNTIRKRYCSEVKLSEIVFHLVAVVDSNSFIVRWIVPSVLVSHIMISTRDIEQSLYPECKITSLTLDGMWLYMSEAEVEAMWLHVSDTKIGDRFHTMHSQIVRELEIRDISVQQVSQCLIHEQPLLLTKESISLSEACIIHKQIVYELMIGIISKNELSQCLMDQQPNLPENASIQLSEAFMNHRFPPSFVDFDMLDIIVQRFGSDCLKSVTKSYSSYMTDFTKQLTAQQFISLQFVHDEHPQYGMMKNPSDFEVPPNFLLMETKIGQDASKCTLEQIDTIRRRYCIEVQLSEIVLHLVTVAESNPFIIRWLVPSSLILQIMQFTKAMKVNFFEEYRIISLTFDGMWLYMNEAEIEAMWLHVSDTKLNDRFRIIHKQIVYYELMIGIISKNELSQCLMDHQPNLPENASIQLSEAFMNHRFPPSFVDFDMLDIIVQRFGSDCLKSVTKSYSSYMTDFTKQLTAQQFMSLQFVHDEHPQYGMMKNPSDFEVPPNFLLMETKIGQDASKCTLEQIDTIRRRYCIEVQLSEIVLHLVTVAESNPFIIRWLVPSSLILQIMQFTKAMKVNFFEEYRIISLTFDGMWLYMNEAEIEAMWLHVSDTKLNDRFRIIHKQIVYELMIGIISKNELSQCLMDHQPNLPENASIQLSEAFMNHRFPPSFVDFDMLDIIVQRFGSDCLKSVTKSYSSYMTDFTKQLTAQQFMSLQFVHDEHPQYGMMKNPSDFEVPPNFLLMETKIGQDASKCTLEQIDTIRRRYCIEVQLSEIVLHLVTVAESNPFIIRWLVPSSLILQIMQFTKAMKVNFFEEYRIISLTFDGMWLYMNEAEIEAMWLHVSDTKLNDRFRIIHKQIVYELKIEKESEKELSQCLMDYQPNLPENASIQLSEAFMNHHFPPSFVDFEMLEIIIDRFGSYSLKSVMKSYCNYMSVFIKHSTAESLVNLQLVNNKHPPNFLIIECRIMKKPSDYTLDNVKSLNTSICTETDFSRFAFAMIQIIRYPVSGSFSVSWLVPTSLASDLIECASQIKDAFYKRESIASLSVGNQWLYNTTLIPFGSKLKKRYQQSQGSPSPVEWIPSPTKKIFRLAMIQRERVQQGHIEDRFVRMTISGRVDDILHAKSPVELEHIFRSTLHGSEIILIEGPPGSGKSTLTVHICQRWGKGELFQQFTIVILVQLRDPAVQRAQTIADLLSIENVAVAQKLATELIATNGRGVLWVLDGWDELPTHLQQDSIFRKLLTPKPSKEELKESEKDSLYAEYVVRGDSKKELCDIYLQNNPQIKRLLNKCSVVVTSRPISSGDLHPVVSSRIEVLGFTQEEQRQYFTECLKGDTNALEALLEKIQENPVVQSICYLPLNAAFVVHSFKCKGQLLANTVYEIYSTVILSCIQCYFEREGRGHDLPRELASLDDLRSKEAVREPFQRLCELAYHGVMANKVTFSSSDLPQGSNTLSLLQAIESFLQSGKSVFYNFLHLSIQEVLSAYYIATWLSDSEQVSQFQQLFNQPRFAAVFQFFSAITKLKSPGIRQVIDQIVEAKSKPLLFSLLNCLHEAQDPSLCLYVAERLEYKLDLQDTSLSPLDCLSISYFLSSVTGKEISVNCWGCSIGDLGAKCLAKYLGSDVDHVSKVAIDLYDNKIHEEGASHIARMLYFIEHVYLSRNPIGDTGASLISEAVRDTVTLKTLILYRCGITSRGAEDLSRALSQNSSLEKLDISLNNLGDEGISHVAEALKQNTQLKELWIGDCEMTDKGAASLASALSVNNSLKMLQMGSLCKRALTKDGLSTISQSLANNSAFVKLAISMGFDSATALRLKQEVNKARTKNGLSPIEIKGEY